MRIYYITGYTKNGDKVKYGKATILNYLPQQVVEAQTKEGEIIRLYKGEYYTR